MNDSFFAFGYLGGLKTHEECGRGTSAELAKIETIRSPIGNATKNGT